MHINVTIHLLFLPLSSLLQIYLNFSSRIPATPRTREEPSPQSSAFHRPNTAASNSPAAQPLLVQHEVFLEGTSFRAHRVWGPTQPVWLPHKVPVMFNHNPPNHYSQPPPRSQQPLLKRAPDRMVSRSRQDNKGGITSAVIIIGFAPADYRRNSLSTAVSLIAKPCPGTRRRGGRIETTTLQLTLRTFLHGYPSSQLLFFSTHFRKVAFLACRKLFAIYWTFCLFCFSLLIFLPWIFM